MTLGQRIRQARLEAGLSQRQLCGDAITRNMLSQIENDSARPSMTTLAHLARQLGKPISYFLQEDILTSPNAGLMAQARDSWARGDARQTRQLLEQFQAPDPSFQPEQELLLTLALLQLAEEAIAQGKQPYALQLLEQAGRFTAGAGYARLLERQRLLLLGATGLVRPERLVQELPSLDAELLLRARAALDAREVSQARALLEAAQNRQDPARNLLLGQALLAQQQYSQALACLQLAQAACPREAWPLLEVCCRELGDFKGAYEYACLQRQ